jgi:hypothetical protein
MKVSVIRSLSPLFLQGAVNRSHTAAEEHGQFTGRTDNPSDETLGQGQPHKYLDK